MKNSLFRLIAVVLGFSVAFALAEIAVRTIRPQEISPQRFTFNPQLGETPVPNQKGWRSFPGVYEFTYSNNSLGFRGSREYGPKKPGEFRLLLLGDSFTYGLGVNDDQTFAYHLEQYLRAHNLPAEVINAGLPGKGTDAELKLFQTVGVKLHPDLTAICFFSNDFQDNARAEYYTILPDGGLRVKPLDWKRRGLKNFLFNFPGYNWLISWSHAANLVKQAAVNYLVARQAGPGNSAPSSSDLVVSYSYAGQRFSDGANEKITAIYVAHLMEAARQAGSQMAFFYIPLDTEVENYRHTMRISPDEEVIKKIIEARGGTLFSLTPVLAARPESIHELFFAEGHFTPPAHEQAGNSMGNYLLNNFIREKLSHQAQQP